MSAAKKGARGYPAPLALQVRLSILADDEPPPRVIERPAPPRLDIREDAFQELIIDLAKRLKWVHWHDNDSRYNEAGLPDLILMRHRLIWRELKTERGTLKREQAAWGQRLLRAGQDWGIWRPHDWDEIVDTLIGER